jgi:LacI family transcriptional regulator
MEYLIQLGHKKIAHIYGEDITYAGYQRRKAYMDVMMEHNLPIRSDYMQDGGFFDFQESKIVMGHILDVEVPPTAVFVAGDVMALGAMQCCYERHIRIPDDLSIIGFDNIRFLEWTTPKLTSIAQDIDQLGLECSNMLIHKIEHPKLKDRRYIKVPTYLVTGSTCRAL